MLTDRRSAILGLVIDEYISDLIEAVAEVERENAGAEGFEARYS